MRFNSTQLLSAVFVVLSAFLFFPVHAADRICNFRAKGLVLNFGLLNPSIAQNVSQPITVATTNADMAGDCVGNGNMTISISGSNSRQLVSGINTINYTISGLPISLPQPGNAPKNNPDIGYITWFTAASQLQGNIVWSAFADAPAGNYSDSVTILINP